MVLPGACLHVWCLFCSCIYLVLDPTAEYVFFDDPSKTTSDPKIVQHKSYTFPSSHCIFCCSCLLPHLFSPTQCSLQMFEIESSSNSKVWICKYLSAGALKVLKTVFFSYCFAQYRHSPSKYVLAKVNVFWNVTWPVKIPKQSTKQNNCKEFKFNRIT